MKLIFMTQYVISKMIVVEKDVMVVKMVQRSLNK